MLKIWNGSQWVEGIPADGDLVREYVFVGTSNEHYREYTYVNDAQEELTYFNANESLESGGVALTGLGNVYYTDANTQVTISADIVDSDGVVQSQIDQTLLGLPPLLKLPVNKYIGGASGQIVDEVYFNATLSSGVLTATGIIPSSGDWKLTAERLNKSIQALGQSWQIDRQDITFLV